MRWVVEAANARIKRWKYLDRILPTSQVPYTGDYVKIVCAISNKYMPPINATKDSEEDQLTAFRMLDRLKQSNELQLYVEEQHLERRSTKWVSTEECQLDNFPKLDDTMLRLLTLGTYQLKLSSSYIQEFVGGECNIQLFKEEDGLLRVRLQSRHVSAKSYLVWIKYDCDHIKAWYCKCRAGARTVGTCSHIAAILWYLGQSMFNRSKYGVKDWGQYLDDAAEVPETVDSSDSEGCTCEE